MKRNSEQILIEWLVLGAQMGDRAALEQLAQQLYPKLIRFAARQLNDAEAAKDVVQNALEVLSRDLHRVKDPAGFLAWMYQVVHRKGVDLIRSWQRDRRWQDEGQVEQSEAAFYESEPAFLQFEKLLSKLDVELYQVVHLHYLEGMALAEIAEIISVPAGTVKSRLYRARHYLKQFVEGESYE